MATNLLPTLEEFLQSPLEKVTQVAPTTMIYGTGGTRRQAMLAGISDQGQDYARWSRDQMIKCCDLIFRHGVKHLFSIILMSVSFNEVTENYREHLWNWADWGLAGEEALANYKQFGWRVRIPFSQHLPQLKAINAKLQQATPEKSPHTLWCCIIPAYDLPWKWALDSIKQAQINTLEDTIQAIYGEVIPPATLFLSSGKLKITSDMLLPFLVRENLECYWSQRPGYSLDEHQLRSIFYDYAYLRQTWQADKTGRAEQVLAQRTIWEQAPTIGLGTRLGPFWYPAATPTIPGAEDKT